MTDTSDRTTHFGFETILEAEKAERVQGVFSSVASKYDIMNDVMSGGVHRVWKDAMMDWLNPRDGQRLLDVAGGTGDIAALMSKQVGSHGSVVLSDINDAMLAVRAQDGKSLRSGGFSTALRVLGWPVP